jgi:hypothetical protein
VELRSVQYFFDGIYSTSHVRQRYVDVGRGVA